MHFCCIIDYDITYNIFLNSFFILFFEFVLNSYFILYSFYYLKYDLLYPLQIEIFIRSNYDYLYVKSLQETIHINPFLEESTLLFFRFHNNSNNNHMILTTYSIIPYEMYLYFIKLQCFCFDKIHIKSYQSLDLPILFCISKDNFIFENIILIYNVFILN